MANQKKEKKKKNIQSDKEVNLFLINSCSIAQNLIENGQRSGYIERQQQYRAPHNDGVE